jgi:cytochrome c oxidase cbb3-type subunit 3
VTRALLLLAACGFACASCRREDRDYRPEAPFAQGARFREDYERNAYALSEGKRLYQAMNCNGCHGYGAGGMGPPLMDDKWIYGYEPDQIFDTIARGRPNGMPAFRGEAREPGITVVGTLPDYQIWQLVAYVRSLSGLAPGDAAPGRSDHMSAAPPENERKPESPVVAPPPDAGDKPK